MFLPTSIHEVTLHIQEGRVRGYSSDVGAYRDTASVIRHSNVGATRCGRPSRQFDVGAGFIPPIFFLPVTLSLSKGLTDRIVPFIHGRSNFGRRAGVQAHDERPHTNGADRASHIPHPGAESDLGYGLGATLWGYGETPQ